MSMTKLERRAKEEVLDILSKEGYPTYARLLNKFDVNLTADPGVVGYMEPDKGRIVLNKGLDIEQVSVIARHEILHEYLTHMQRMEKHVGADKWANRTAQQHQWSNIAGDYEISNKGYTEKDKETVRNIKLNDKVLKGLVTEDDHPDWVNLSLEEMYDELAKLQKQDQQMEPQIGDKGDQQIQDAEEMERKAEQIADAADQAQNEQGGTDSEGNNSKSGDSGEGQEGSSSEEGSEDSGEGPSSGEESQGGGESEGSDSQSNSEGESGSESSETGSPSDGTSGSSNDPLQNLKDNAEQVADAAKDFADQLKQDKAEEGEDGNVFDTPQDKAEDAANEARLNQIKKMFNDLQTQENILGETEEAIRKEQRIKADRNLAKYKASPLQNFKLSLQGFIKNQISTVKGDSWSRINKTYAHSGILKPGKTRFSQGKVPLINVYFDQSGSWDEDDIKVGEQAIATLGKYVKQGDINIDLYYFSNNVHGDGASARREGGTDLQPVLNHIQQTKPDNVIIMTDADGDWTSYESSVTVPGAVWFLWRGGVSEKLKQHLKGKELTKSFELK